MKRYFLETSVIIDYLKGNMKTVEIIDNLSGELISSFVCLAELYEGIYRVKEKDKLEQGVLDFFAGMSEIYGVDKDIAAYFGKIRAELKRSGEVIEDIDIFISATCLSYNLVLVTRNVKHFARIKELEIFRNI